jgi:hypothetical protein
LCGGDDYRRVGFYPPWYQCGGCGYERRLEGARVLLLEPGSSPDPDALLEELLLDEPGVFFLDPEPDGG